MHFVGKWEKKEAGSFPASEFSVLAGPELAFADRSNTLEIFDHVTLIVGAVVVTVWLLSVAVIVFTPAPEPVNVAV